MSRSVKCFAALLAMAMTSTYAAETTLPEPLTLDYALSLADEPHPQLLRAEANLAAALANVDDQAGQSGLVLGADASARWIEPPAALSALGNEDHRARLYARKRIFDFGRGTHQTAAAQAQADAQRLQVIEVRSQRQLEIMERYFAVLLADLEFAHHNENMATAFIRYDRTRERKDVGQNSEFDVTQNYSESQHVRAQRYAALYNQRATRAQLAIALNRPGQLSPKLTPPAAIQLPQNLPDVAELQRQAQRDNPLLLAVRAQLQAAQERRLAARAHYFPTLDAEAEAGKYSRDIGGNDHWRAAVTLNIPLYQGGRVGAQVDSANADVRRLEADLLERERAVADAVLDCWLNLSKIKYQRDDAKALLDYRGAYLDRSRTLYEQEVRADLGDAMVELTRAELTIAQTDYRAALLWARLQALTGQPTTTGKAPK
ncbi:MAG: TolC family protein [Gammaproteobacteria bacterium]|nr:TolC family protein [Gammaproteobacteria bacterium]